MGFRDARERAGKTVLEVSRLLKVSPTAIYHWEDGTYLPNSFRLTEIAMLYGCTVDALLTGTRPASAQ